MIANSNGVRYVSRCPVSTSKRVTRKAARSADTIGTALQFGVMPLAGWAVGLALGLPRDLLVGLVLVGACPGGTASNVICYLARGDVALSITLTTVSTVLAFLPVALSKRNICW